MEAHLPKLILLLSLLLVELNRGTLTAMRIFIITCKQNLDSVHCMVNKS